ncbi:MAG: glycosyltransferase [Sphaerochaeta sp.]|nr:glycosyltransferase [Sphaerochaeta sp.]
MNQKKTDFDCIIIISNYLWNGKEEDQGQSIHYLAHELAFKQHKPVLFINLVASHMVIRNIGMAKGFPPGTHRGKDFPLTLINDWGPDWRENAHTGKKLPVRRLVKRIVKAIHRSSFSNPLLIFTEPTTLPLVKSLRAHFRPDGAQQVQDMGNTPFPVIWYCCDNFPEGDLRRAETILKAIAEIADVADGICTVSPTLEQLYAPLLPTFLLRNAADRDFFQQVKASTERSGKDFLGSDIKRMRIVYIGMLNQRIDYPALEKAVLDHPDFSFVFIGVDKINAGDDFYENLVAIKNAGNTYFTGSKNRQEVAEIFSVCDIGIIPYAKTPFNLSSGPLKLYEYAASDLPSISTNLPAMEHSRTFAYLVDDGDFSLAIDKVSSDYAQYRERIIEFSKRNTWRTRTEELFGFVDSVTCP